MSDIVRPSRAQEVWDKPSMTSSERLRRSRSKRAMDVLFSATLIFFLLPLLVIVAMLVKFTSQGPVLFRQRRTGLNGQTFRIYKFRTMTVMEDGDNIKHASKDDKRVTKVGAVLRKSSIDELPQLFNILKGDMSLVGPRPHALTHDTKYAALIPEYNDRFGAKPGLTGLAQVSGLRGDIIEIDCMRDRVRADIAYISDWSLTRDIHIILRTVPLVFADSKAF